MSQSEQEEVGYLVYEHIGRHTAVLYNGEDLGLYNQQHDLFDPNGDLLPPDW